MTISEILSIPSADLTTYSYDDIFRIQKAAAQAVNRRLRNLEAKDLKFYSPAYQSLRTVIPQGQMQIPIELDKGTGKRNRARAIFLIHKSQDFLRAKTSLVKGARKYKSVQERLTGSTDEKYQSKFWAAWRYAVERYPALFPRIGSDPQLEEAKALFNFNKSIEDNAEVMAQAAHSLIRNYFEMS